MSFRDHSFARSRTRCPCGRRNVGHRDIRSGCRFGDREGRQVVLSEGVAEPCTISSVDPTTRRVDGHRGRVGCPGCSGISCPSTLRISGLWDRRRPTGLHRCRKCAREALASLSRPTLMPHGASATDSISLTVTCGATAGTMPREPGTKVHSERPSGKCRVRSVRALGRRHEADRNHRHPRYRAAHPAQGRPAPDAHPGKTGRRLQTSSKRGTSREDPDVSFVGC
jgi:hypothetical protein